MTGDLPILILGAHLLILNQWPMMLLILFSSPFVNDLYLLLYLMMLLLLYEEVNDMNEFFLQNSSQYCIAFK
jgi:hypothetical protein